MRSAFLIDADGVIVKVMRSVKATENSEQVLALLSAPAAG